MQYLFNRLLTIVDVYDPLEQTEYETLTKETIVSVHISILLTVDYITFLASAMKLTFLTFVAELPQMI